MRGLHGDFTTMPLKDVLFYLGNKRASGTLSLECGAVRKQAVLRDGQVVNASSNQRREYLGQFLINTGYLSEDQFHKAFQMQQEGHVLIGKVLVTFGLVGEQVVMKALVMKARETLLDALTWPEGGQFAFDPTPPVGQVEGLNVRVDLLEIHREAEFRETAWQAIRAAFPHGRLALRVNERKLPEPPRPGSLDARLIALIQEGQTIDDMVLALHATDFFLYQRLYALYRLGAVEVAGEAEPRAERLAGGEGKAAEAQAQGEDAPPAAEALGAGELSWRARALLEAGNALEAEATARKSFELSPTPENLELLHRAEAALTKKLKSELMQPPKVPSLQMAPQQLKALELSAPEKYLLSRIDGTRDVASIVHVSPLQELEALKLFQRFVDSGLVRLA